MSSGYFRDPLRLSRRSKPIGVYGGVSTLYSVRLRGGAHLLPPVSLSVISVSLRTSGRQGSDESISTWHSSMTMRSSCRDMRFWLRKRPKAAETAPSGLTKTILHQTTVRERRRKHEEEALPHARGHDHQHAQLPLDHGPQYFLLHDTKLGVGLAGQGSERCLQVNPGEGRQTKVGLLLVFSHSRLADAGIFEGRGKMVYAMRINTGFANGRIRTLRFHTSTVAGLPMAPRAGPETNTHVLEGTLPEHVTDMNSLPIPIRIGRWNLLATIAAARLTDARVIARVTTPDLTTGPISMATVQSRVLN
ncbi:hypothetical protein HBI26_226530 [Parastagonospora nodorum]|nr:hypothetical protein HBH97_236390 [Parastagonospora nodorum]KAH4378192.1 hypothetical protein HBH99_204120 [Parastagonospora nodorum]KAH4891783.1 hypothetical protein HBH74_218940 [Parastagonospora nodorum]KAH4894019.1 hypothetical protein HBI80_237450 [Parastagonospora nodorum]KAH4915748.1 hypothetical protein HBH73_238300 [Parastagonospora nodorum]